MAGEFDRWRPRRGTSAATRLEARAHRVARKRRLSRRNGGSAMTGVRVRQCPRCELRSTYAQRVRRPSARWIADQPTTAAHPLSAYSRCPPPPRSSSPHRRPPLASRAGRTRAPRLHGAVCVDDRHRADPCSLSRLATARSDGPGSVAITAFITSAARTTSAPETVRTARRIGRPGPYSQLRQAKFRS